MRADVSTSRESPVIHRRTAREIRRKRRFGLLQRWISSEKLRYRCATSDNLISFYFRRFVSLSRFLLSSSSPLRDSHRLWVCISSSRIIDRSFARSFVLAHNRRVRRPRRRLTKRHFLLLCDTNNRRGSVERRRFISGASAETVR